MPRSLDFKRPYAEVHGLPGVAYTQDGIDFKGDGIESFNAKPFVDEVIVETEDYIPAVTCIEQPSLPLEQNRPVEDLHWRHLKAMVEVYGGVWSNRAEGIAFIKGKSNGLAAN